MTPGLDHGGLDPAVPGLAVPGQDEGVVLVDGEPLVDPDDRR